MTITQAMVYGLVQGFTEFLPVSSSAHLILLPWFFKWSDPGLAFDVALHWGTLIGVVAYYRHDLWELFKGWVGSYFGGQSPINALPWQIMVATIPAVAVGYFLEDRAASAFRSPWVLVATLSGVGLLLYLADRMRLNRNQLEKITWPQTILIGLAQSLAIIPGISRSGITIVTALFLGLTRGASVKFSFLLSIPIILGAGIMEWKYLIANVNNPYFSIGLLSSAVSGFLAISALVKYVKTRSFIPFVIYRMILAGVIAGLLIWGYGS